MGFGHQLSHRYASRNRRQGELEAEFCDFVEDQREKEGRLFFRWCTAMMRGNGGNNQSATIATAAESRARSSFTAPGQMSDLERINSYVDQQMDTPLATADTAAEESSASHSAHPAPPLAAAGLVGEVQCCLL